MYYAVIDTSKSDIKSKLIGYHDKKKTAAQYYYSLKQLENSEKYKFVKCKKKVIKQIPEHYDYYLVRFGRNYIPSKYFEFAKDDIYTVIFEYKHTMEILMRIFELEKLSQKDKDTIEESLFIVQDVMDREMDCVISPDQLKEMESMYNEFKQKVFWSEPISEDEWVPFFEVEEDDLK